MELDELVDTIMVTIIPQARLTDDDRQAITDNRAFLLGLGDALVDGFFDIVFNYEPTSAVFSDAEHEHPSEFVTDWWERTVTGSLDEDYFRWMALVGLVHIRRDVKNPMMISMFTIVQDVISAAALEQLDPENAKRLRIAFRHYGAIVASMITESYTVCYKYAIEDIAGIDLTLLDRMARITAGDLETRGRETLAS